MIDIDMPKMRVELISDEGLRRSAYRDSEGFLTIGVGRLIDSARGGGLSVAECLVLLNNDIEASLKNCSTLSCWPGLSDTRRRALVNMTFQLGFAGMKSFGTFLSLLEQGKYKEAGEDLKNTTWFKQVPARANRIIKMIVEG